MKDNTKYVIFTIGSIGIFLLTLGIFTFIVMALDVVESVMEAHIPTLLGFLTIVYYINFLESKAGISSKLIWIRNIILSLILAGIYFSFYK